MVAHRSATAPRAVPRTRRGEDRTALPYAFPGFSAIARAAAPATGLRQLQPLVLPQLGQA